MKKIPDVKDKKAIQVAGSLPYSNFKEYFDKVYLNSSKVIAIGGWLESDLYKN